MTASTTTPKAATILRELASMGYIHLPVMTDADASSLVANIGRPVEETVVQLRAGVPTYLCQPEAVPHHTDHPAASLIAWRCEEQDSDGGAQTLCDGWQALRRCSSRTVRSLEGVFLEARQRGGAAADRVPVVRRVDGQTRIFFAPWLRPTSDDIEHHRAFREFAQAVEVDAREAVAVRLAPGEVLLVDNGRILHGRPPLARSSRRRLRRFWISRPGM